MVFVKNNGYSRGVITKEIPCLIGEGAPSTTTEGAVGSLYMDIASNTGNIYKCVANSNDQFTWLPIAGGASIQLVKWEEND